VKRLFLIPCVFLLGCPKLLQSVTDQVSRDAAEATHRLVQNIVPPKGQQQGAPQQQGQAVPASAQQPARLQLKGKLAVLELHNSAKDLSKENAQYFTDVIRQTSLRMQPGLEVMTRENLMVLLEASGKKLDECEGECEVDTGRRIGADSVVSGDISRLGSRFKLSLKLHDTHAGRLLSSAIASGETVEQLDTAIAEAAKELFQPR
jgi:TolB-like protein